MSNVKASNAASVALAGITFGSPNSQNNIPNQANSRGPSASTQLIARMVKVSVITKSSEIQTRRFVFDPDKFTQDSELLNSIKSEGIVEPLVVRPLNKDLLNPEYELIAGERRLSAAKLLNLEFVPARIIDIDIENANFKTIAENSGRRDLDDYEKAIVIGKLYSSHPEWTLKDISERTGWSTTKISRVHRAYENSCPELRNLLAEGFSAGNVLDLQPAFETIAPEHRQTLHDRVFLLSDDQVGILTTYIKNHNNVDPIAFIDNAFGDIVKTPVNVEGGEQINNVAPIMPSTDSFTITGEVISDSPVVSTVSEMASDTIVNEEKESTEVAVATNASPSSIDNNSYISKVSGLAPDLVCKVIELSKDENLDKNSIITACMYIARGGDLDSSIGLLKMSRGNKKATSLVEKLLFLYLHYNASIDSIVQNDPAIGAFVQTLFFEDGHHESS
jgi:ParB/RepB/Spo0J family partition protein